MAIKIALIGLGNVGSCFLQILTQKASLLEEKYGIRFKTVAIFEIDGALVNEEGINVAKLMGDTSQMRDSSDWSKDVKAIDAIPSLDLDVCIETTPTNPETGQPALGHVLTAIEHGIDVVTSNKGPFYLEYKKIKDLAKKKDALVKYEATVMSGVPILSTKEDLMGTEFTGIRAILNGTCNYILSRMTSEGVPFEIALTEAQELGYAEADPTLDIEGYDAAGKLVILANELLAWERSITDVEIKGIKKITPQAIELAKSDGYLIKHLAIVEHGELIVEPRLIPRQSPLNINGTLNVVELQTKHAGPIVLMGRGAGGCEAASAILNDLLVIAREKHPP
ncbi:homoserine dehydrogenase [bacterium]|nr:homoserine dehydrogenase [bacterium]